MEGQAEVREDLGLAHTGYWRAVAGAEWECQGLDVKRDRSGCWVKNT